MSTTKLRVLGTSPFVQGVAAEVRALMGRHNLRTSELARLTGLPYYTLNRSVQGVRPFAVDELEAIASALNCSVADFLVEPPHPRHATPVAPPATPGSSVSICSPGANWQQTPLVAA